MFFLRYNVISCICVALYHMKWHNLFTTLLFIGILFELLWKTWSGKSLWGRWQLSITLKKIYLQLRALQREQQVPRFSFQVILIAMTWHCWSYFVAHTLPPWTMLSLKVKLPYYLGHHTFKHRAEVSNHCLYMTHIINISKSYELMFLIKIKIFIFGR